MWWWRYLHSHKWIKVNEITMFNVAQYTYFLVNMSRRYLQNINLLAWASLLHWLTLTVGSAFSVLLWWWILCLLLVHKTYFNNIQSIISISLDPNFLFFCMFLNISLLCNESERALCYTKCRINKHNLTCLTIMIKFLQVEKSSCSKSNNTFRVLYI